MIEITLIGGIVDQPTSDTVITINEDEIAEIRDNPSGNSTSIIKMKGGNVYYTKETKQELINKIPL